MPTFVRGDVIELDSGLWTSYKHDDHKIYGGVPYRIVANIAKLDKFELTKLDPQSPGIHKVAMRRMDVERLFKRRYGSNYGPGTEKFAVGDRIVKRKWSVCTTVPDNTELVVVAAAAGGARVQVQTANGKHRVPNSWYFANNFSSVNYDGINFNTSETDMANVKEKSKYIVVERASGNIISSSGLHDQDGNPWTEASLEESLTRVVSDALRKNPSGVFDVYTLSKTGSLPPVSVTWS